MSTNSLNSRPSADEIEISVFGPGVGECIVIHAGDDRWLTVDSCLRDGEPVALWYLRQLGVSPDQIEHVIVSHWHSDHIRGIGALYEATTNAAVHCSSALNAREFKRLVKAGRAPFVDLGTRELERLLKARKARNPTGRDVAQGPRWLGELTLISRSAASEIVALSPSPATATLAYQEIAQLLPTGGPKRNVVAQSANHVAVVISVRCHPPDGKVVLLGSDLEVSSQETGWHAVVPTAKALGLDKSSVYKVAHHGSPTAFDQDVMNALVANDAHCVVTPFQRSRLPSQGDRARLLSHSPNLYQTASDAGVKPMRHDLEGAIKLAVRDRRFIGTKMGHVRLRISSTGQLDVELFGGAVRC